MDIISSAERSKNMSAIRGQNTKPEQLIRQWLFAKGYRYRLHVKYIPGHPDLYLRKYNTAIFVNGCFWHRHNNCKFAYTPKSNVEFWNKKFENNIRRDDEVKRLLEEQGIKQLVVWECVIKKMARNIEYKYEILNAIELFLSSGSRFLEI